VTLTPRQRVHIQRVMESLLAEIKRAGLSVMMQKMDHASAFYDRAGKRIVLGRLKRNPLWIPAVLDRLFSLAHEFGHHQACNDHEKVGRTIDRDFVPDVLFDETRAWQRAFVILQRHKMRDAILWEALAISTGNSLCSHVQDYEAHWWLVDHMKRMKIRCPQCGSTNLRVIGEETRRDCAIRCCSCKAHTKPTRTVQALAKGFCDNRFTGLCLCGS
jgi:hypothetical protein